MKRINTSVTTRNTSMAAALVAASVNNGQLRNHWVARCVADRALHTDEGQVKDRSGFLLTNRTANKLGFI